MEYSLGGFGASAGHHTGHHTATVFVVTPLPCAEFPTQWQAVCYASAGAYRQYLPGYESFEQSYRWCANQPAEYVSACRYGVSQRAELSKIYQ
jgi:hypothetical protein